MNTITEEEALNRMAAYCSAAEHCKAEVMKNSRNGACLMK